MRLRHTTAALLLALAGCASTPRTAAPPASAPAASTHEAAVYAAVVDRFVALSKVAVVMDSTAPLRDPLVRDVGQRAGAELAASFLEANRAPRALPRPLPAAPTIRFTRRAELPFSSARGDLNAAWRRFHEQFAGAEGYHEFSGIGFDASRSTALLYVSHSCGSLCGSGSLVTLRRTGGRWQVTDTQTLWVS